MTSKVTTLNSRHIGINMAMYSSTLRQTAINILYTNSIYTNPRNICIVEDMILRMIDYRFINMISPNSHKDLHLTFVFSRNVYNPYSSAFFHPKKIFLFNINLASSLSNIPQFPIHYHMKKERDQVIKFLRGPQYAQFPECFLKVPIDQYYYNPQMKHIQVITPMMASIVNLAIPENQNKISEKIKEITSFHSTKLLESEWWESVINSKNPKHEIKIILEAHKKNSDKITEIAENILNSIDQ